MVSMVVGDEDGLDAHNVHTQFAHLELSALTTIDEKQMSRNRQHL